MDFTLSNEEVDGGETDTSYFADTSNDTSETDLVDSEVETDTKSDNDPGDTSDSDSCPDDPNKTDPGECGCGIPEGACNGGPYIELTKTTFAENETIVAHFFNLPTSPDVWIGVFVIGDPQRSPLQSKSTDSLPHGYVEFEGLPPGSYDARLYLGSSAEAKHMMSFLVAVSNNTQAVRYDGVGTQEATKQKINILPDTYYNVRADLHVAPGSSGHLVFDTTDRFDDTCQKVIIESDSWIRFTCRFHSSFYTNVELRFFVATAVEFRGKAYFDNVFLAQEGSTENLVLNGDFENGRTGWQMPSGIYTLTDENLPPY